VAQFQYFGTTVRKCLNCLIGRKSKLAVENKILIYKAIIMPIWMYGLELWGCTSKSNTSLIQRSHSKILRMIVDAPWYVSNATLHADQAYLLNKMSSNKEAINFITKSKPMKTRS
jgi:hypothetical protein